MKSHKSIILAILLCFMLPYTYGGCVVVISSGDTSSQNDQVKDETSGGFVGIASNADITSANAKFLAAGAFAGGLTGTDSGKLMSKQRVLAGRADLFRPLRFPLVLGDALRRIELDTDLNIATRATNTTETNEMKGICGGELSHTLTVDWISGKFSGTLLFTDYCDDGIAVSGETAVTGTFEAGSGAFNTAAFTFDDLSDESHILNGEISMDFSDEPVVAILSAYSKNRQTGHVFWLKNYSINLFELADRVEAEFFGTFYHPDYGFVTLTTLEPFVVFEADEWPVSGYMALKGANGTRAHLMALDYEQYRIEADTDGDGTVDWNSGILAWGDL